MDGNEQLSSVSLQSFFEKALNSLASNIAIIDENGAIVATNFAWNEFALQNQIDISSVGVGMNYLDVCEKSAARGDDIAANVCDYIKIILTGRRKKISFQYPCHSPSEKRWFKCNLTALEHNDRLYIVVAHENITSVRRFQFEVQQLEELFNNLFEYVLEPIVMTNHQGKVSMANDAAVQVFGCTREEFSGRHIYQLIPEDNWVSNPELQAAFDEKRMFRATHNEYPTLWAVTKSGKPFPVEISLNPLDTEGREIIAVTIRDISDRLHLEQQLRYSQKMENIGRLASGIAHDYNNMLGVVLGYAELLEMSLENQPKLKDYAAHIYQAGTRGQKLTKKILELSKSHTSDDAGLMNMNDVLNEEYSVIQKTLTPRIKLEYILQDDLWLTRINKSDLENAIFNMAINAMHAMPEKGRLTIMTRNCNLDSEFSESLGIEPGGYVVLSVGDTGLGMDQATVDKIFEPFFSTKGDMGTGLGLSQVYDMVENVSGCIKVYSELHCGTRFDLYFPRYTQDFQDDDIVEQDDFTPGNAIGTENILIVDDEVSLQLMLSEYLSKQGYSIYCANNAEEALDTIRRIDIDLVLSDVIMPGMDGCELASFIEKEYPSIKILLVSGYGSHINIDLVSERVRNNLLSKPYSIQDVLSKIRMSLDS